MKKRTVTVERINDIAREGAPAMLRVDRQYAAAIDEIAQDLYDHAAERAVILLSGPSGSGKTTSAEMLEARLDAMGAETHTISMDNFFSPFTPEQWRLFERGELDLESPSRIDIPLLNDQLEKIAACEPIRLPIYDFKESKRYFREEIFQRKPGELVLLEGIHALNPDVILLPDEQTARIYVSVRTRVELGDLELHPAFIRLLRRMIRDRDHRARSLAETWGMFDSVERGEQTYIAPYKQRAQFELDSFHAYELPLYKTILHGDLGELAGDGRLDGLIAVLDAIERAYPADLPEGSLIREFVG